VHWDQGIPVPDVMRNEERSAQRGKRTNLIL